MMGFDPMTLEYIAARRRAGPRATARRENIEIVGDAELADQRWGFSVGDNGASMVGDVMWFGPLKRFQKLFFHTPLVNLFVMGSEAYHDYYRWPLRDRRVFEQWREPTHVGPAVRPLPVARHARRRHGARAAYSRRIVTCAGSIGYFATMNCVTRSIVF